MDALLVFAGGLVGAPLRFGIGRWVTRRFKRTFPLGTFLINISGSLGLGLLNGAKTDPTIGLLIGVGFLGTFTTFSTFVVEAVGLFEKKKPVLALLYVLSSALFGILGAYLGQAWYTGL